VTSRADEFQDRIADLSELMTAAQKNLAALAEDKRPYADTLTANLQTTIEAVQRELTRARKALDHAQGLDAAAEILAQVKTQAQERQRTAKWAEIRANAKWALERAAALDAAEAIMAPIIAAAAAKNRKNKKNKKKRRARKSGRYCSGRP
jgi:hypothetical protein